MAATPSFNATASASFAAEVKAAQEAHARNPTILEPFLRLEDGLTQRRTACFREAFASPTTGMSFTAFAAIGRVMGDAAEELKDVAPMDAPAKLADFVDRFQALLKKTVTESTANREEMIAFAGSFREIAEDGALFDDAVQKLAALPAGNPEGYAEAVAALKGRSADTRANIALQTHQLSALEDTARQQLEQMAKLRQVMNDKLGMLKDATQAVEVFKDFIDSCSTGTRTPVAVSKPFSLRHRNNANQN